MEQTTQNSPTVPQPNDAAAPRPPAATPNPPIVAEEDEKFFAALGYFAFLFVIPLVAKPKSKYCRFHAKQSMVLFIITILVFVVLAAIPLIGSLLTLALFAVYVIAIYRAYNGELWNIPFVSSFAGKMDLDAIYGKAGVALSGISGMKEKVEGFAGKTEEAVKNMATKQEEKPTQPPVPPPSAPPPAAPPAQG